MNFFDPAKNKRIAIVSPIIAALIAGTYYIAMKMDFDADIGHFARGSVPFIICVVLSVISGAVAVLSYYSAKKYDLERSDNVPPTYVFGAVLASILSFAVLFFGLRDMKLTVLSAGGTFTSLSADNKLEFVSLLLSPTIAGAYILTLVKQTRNTWSHTLFCIFAALCMNVYLFACYFDFSLPLNSPVRNYITVMDSAMLLFFLSEAKLSFVNEKNRVSYAFSYFASFLCSTITLGISLGMFLSRLLSPVVNDPQPNLLKCAMYFAVSVTALARLNSLGAKEKTAPDTENESEVASENAN